MKKHYILACCALCFGIGLFLGDTFHRTTIEEEQRCPALATAVILMDMVHPDGTEYTRAILDHCGCSIDDTLNLAPNPNKSPGPIQRGTGAIH